MVRTSDVDMIKAYRDAQNQPFVVEVRRVGDSGYDVLLRPEMDQTGLFIFADEVALNGSTTAFQHLKEEWMGEVTVEKIIFRTDEFGETTCRIELVDEVPTEHSYIEIDTWTETDQELQDLQFDE